MPQFEKGKKPGPGRPKGRLNNATLEAKQFCASIVDGHAYRQRLQERALEGSLPPALEQMIWHYAKGKPPDKVEVTGDEGGPLRVVFGGRYRDEDVA